MSSPSVPVSHNRWRFSLRGLLVFTILILLVVSHWRTNQLLVQRESQLAEVRSRLEQVLNELGRFEIADREQAAAMVQPHQPEYCWRVYLPPSAGYRLKVALAGIGPTGLPTRIVADIPIRYDHAETFLVSVILRDPTGLPRTMEVDVDGVRRFEGELAGGSALFASPAFGQGFYAGDGQPRLFDPLAPIVLLRRQMIATATQPTFEDWQKPQEGIMVWLEKDDAAGLPLSTE